MAEENACGKRPEVRNKGWEEGEKLMCRRSGQVIIKSVSQSEQGMNFFLDVYPEGCERGSGVEVKVEAGIEAEAVRVERVRKSGRKRASRRYSKYTWNSTENRLYVKFLASKEALFDLSLKEKKQIRLNVLMSNKIKTRSPAQCHSHHQKMILKYGSIPGILKHLSTPQPEPADLPLPSKPSPDQPLPAFVDLD